MKNILVVLCALCHLINAAGQDYPEPEFSNEVYFLKKDSNRTLVRLEKMIAGMETKTKAGGFGGFENGYMFENEKSSVRISKGDNLSFVYTTSPGASNANMQRDSLMRAYGVDPSTRSAAGMSEDPSGITLYKTESGKGQRKILLQKGGGAFSAKKLQSSDKFTFSVKSIRNGYYELVIDKTLPKGEYAFSMMRAGMNSMDGSVLLFCFGVD